MTSFMRGRKTTNGSRDENDVICVGVGLAMRVQIFVVWLPHGAFVRLHCSISGRKNKH